jgi:rhodanese-related sulfurtransferase
MSVFPLQVDELAALLAKGDAHLKLLDVREPWEVQTAAMPGAVHIPMREIMQRVDELEADAPWVCVCHHGARSMQVAMFLKSRGFATVYNLTGGIDAWSRQIDPTVPLY